MLPFCLLLILYDNNAFSSNLKVIATIKPIHALVASVTDGVLEPNLLSYRIISAHDYLLRPSSISSLELSDIVFYVDDELETFVKAFAKNRQLIPLSSVVPLLHVRPHSFARYRITHYEHYEKDLHIWLNPENAKLIVRFISTKLSEIDKENSHKYNANAINTIKRIDQEAEKMTKELEHLKDQKYVVMHDAYQYFEKYFGLAYPSVILSIEEDAYIGMKSLIKLKNIIEQENIKCIFSHSHEDSIDPTAFGDDVEARILDPIGSDVEPGKDAYFTIMNNIVQNFKSCFNMEV